MIRIVFFTFLLFITRTTVAQSGILDNTFGTGGIVRTTVGSFSSIGDIAVQPDGKIVVSGSAVNGASSFDFALARYNYDGTLDNTFGTGGIVLTVLGNTAEQLNSIALQPDGKILVCGYIDNGSNKDIAVARYNNNGTLDNTFGTGGVVITQVDDFDDFAYDIALQADGKILVTGIFNGTGTGFNATPFVIRYTTNGTPDNTFGTAGIVRTTVGASHNLITAMALQPDGKIIICGNSSINATMAYEDFLLIRYNSDGTLDNTFDTDGIRTFGLTNSRDVFQTVIVYPDGKIAAAGRTYNFTTSIYQLVVCRFTANGSLDNSFAVNGIAIPPIICSDVSYLSEIALQSDNKLVAGGFYANTPASSNFVLMRYTDAGQLDNSFGTNGITETSITNWDAAVTLALGTNRIYLGGNSYTDFTFTDHKFTLAAYKNCLQQPLVRATIDTGICKGIPFLGTLITADTVYNDTLQNTCLLDSIIRTYNVHIINADTTIAFDTTVCYGALYKNQPVYSSFTDRDTLTTNTSCGLRNIFRNIQVRVTPNITNGFGRDTVLCTNASITLNAHTPARSYLWQNNTTAPVFTVTDAGTYWVEVTDTFNCKKRDSITVAASDLFLQIVADTVVNQQGNVVLTPLTNGTVSWTTSPTLSCTVCQSTVATPLANTVYQLRADKAPCSVTAQVNVKLKLPFYFYIPTAFSPNRDGLNDVFKIITNAEGPFLLEIYNR